MPTEPIDVSPPAAEPEAPAEPAGDADADGPGEYEMRYNDMRVVRHFASREDARQQILARNPNINIDAVTIRKLG